MKKRVLAITLISAIMATSVLAFTVSFARAEVVPIPCELYTQADAHALFNEDVSDGVARETVAPAGNSCRYTFKKNGSIFGVTVRVSTTVEIAGEGIFDSAKDVFERQVKARMASEEAVKKFKDIKGIGDGAFWEGTSLWVLKEDVLLIIKVNSPLEGSFKNREVLDAAQEEQDLALSLKVSETVLPKLE